MARALVRTIKDERRNLLINGNFDFWQRGTSFTSAGSNVYTADRWKNQLAGADITRQNVSADIPEAQYGIRYVASSEEILLEQRIEASRVRHLVGSQVTLSFKARATSGTPDLELDVLYADAEDVWSSSTLVIDGQVLGTLGASFQTLSYTFTVNPLMASNGFNVVIKTPSTVSATVDFAQVQLLEGSQGVFRRAGNDFAEELQLCQSYYELVGINGSGANNGAGFASFCVNFSTQKRAVPTVAGVGGGFSSGTTLIENINQYSARLTNSGFGTGSFCTGFVRFDSEL